MHWIVKFLLLTQIGIVFSKQKIVDLTHTLGDSAVHYPSMPPFNFTILLRNRTADGYWLEYNKFATAEHIGTHLDAPSHFYDGSWRTQQIPMERLCGHGVIVDVKSKASLNIDYRVTVEDLQNWEKKYGKIPEKAIVLMNSGWSDRYPNKTLVFGTSTTEDSTTFHFPGWHEDAVSWLVKYRDINVLGVDTPSNDYGQSTTYPGHIIIAERNIPGVENVAYLDRIPPNGTMIYVAVIKLQHGSGGPARVFAVIPEIKDGETSGSSLIRSSFYIICFFVMIFYINTYFW